MLKKIKDWAVNFFGENELAKLDEEFLKQHWIDGGGLHLDLERFLQKLGIKSRSR